MKILDKYWKLLIALLLLGAAVYGYFNIYENEKIAYEKESKQLQTYIASLEANIRENAKYADVQDKLPDAIAAVDASRLELYKHFPVEMMEEDQIMYVLYLETIFGTEIHFSFSDATPYVAMRDGSNLMALVLSVNYETTYQGFQDMITYLATDSRITSVNTASIQYDAKADKATGQIQLMLYLMDSELLEYLPPDVNTPETGKDNVFD